MDHRELAQVRRWNAPGKFYMRMLAEIPEHHPAMVPALHTSVMSLCAWLTTSCCQIVTWF